MQEEIEIKDNLPCVECCNMDESCCRNPQITWTMTELDNLVSVHGTEILEDKALFKGELPGLVYIIKMDQENTKDGDSVHLDYCAFYDIDNRRCSVYHQRPVVCATYGDPEYNECPYQAFANSEPGTLTDFIVNNREVAGQMHKTAVSHPQKFAQDFIIPFVESFEASDPEYNEWWESLPEANFIRQ